MPGLKKEDIINSLREAGIADGDIVLVHSSFKSLGHIEGGAETVISAFEEVIGKEGTLVFPTFVQKDFLNAYETWHIDKDSDTGYLTNYFRKRSGSVRSDHPTHSVAASGRDAVWLTETHGHTSKRIGNMGDTTFAPDSPWEKMYQKNAKVVLLGVGTVYITFKHYTESVYVEKCLDSIQNSDKRQYMENQLARYKKDGIWPSISTEWVAEQIKSKKVKCGEATVTLLSAKDFVDFALSCLESGDNRILREFDKSVTPNWETWIGELKQK